jgi:hypothetical protein
LFVYLTLRTYPHLASAIRPATTLCSLLLSVIVFLLQTETSLYMGRPILLLALSCLEIVWYCTPSSSFSLPFSNPSFLLLNCRGSQFVFFRMENEHFNCSDRYNIVQGMMTFIHLSSPYYYFLDVPLPFTNKYEALAGKNALRNIKRENSKHSSKRSLLQSKYSILNITTSFSLS